MVKLRTSQRISLTLIMASMSIVGGQTTANNRTYSLEKRGGLSLLGGLGGGTGLGGSSKSLEDPCGYIELSPENWQQLGIDEYLAHYPNGDKLTLQQYAAELNVPNFYCGIGMQCSAGQEWNNFMNSLYKAVDHAISLVKDAASSIISDLKLPVDTIPRRSTHEVNVRPASTSIIPPADQLYGWTVADVVCGVLGSISALAVPAFIPADSIQVAMAELAVMPAFQALPDMEIGKAKDKPREGQEAYNAARAALDARDWKAFDQIQSEKDDRTIQNFFQRGQRPPLLITEGSTPHPGPTSGTAAPISETPPPSPRPEDHNPQTHRRERRSIIKHKDGHYSSYAYTRYAYLESRLSSIQNRIQSYVAVNLKMATMAPILSQGGLAEILQGGSYLNPNPTTNQLQEGGKALAQISALAQLFQSLKIFVAIGLGECTAGGPNGAWSKKDELSYCSPDGLMMNIVQSGQTGLVIAMPNAHLLEEKYGYTTEFLARSAWECQKKYGVYTNSTAPPPVNMGSDCIFPIAVCDCTLAAVDKIHKGKNDNLIKACREGANLPI